MSISFEMQSLKKINVSLEGPPNSASERFYVSNKIGRILFGEILESWHCQHRFFELEQHVFNGCRPAAVGECVLVQKIFESWAHFFLLAIGQMARSAFCVKKRFADLDVPLDLHVSHLGCLWRRTVCKESPQDEVATRNEENNKGQAKNGHP